MCTSCRNSWAIARRSPIRTRRALIAGIGMDISLDSLVGLYLAGLCGLGYGARQIIEAQRAVGISTDTIVISGGAGQSPLVRQVLADATGLAVAASSSPEPVLLGSAILAAVAAGRHADVGTAMSAMSELGDVWQPDPAVAIVACEALRRFSKIASCRSRSGQLTSVVEDCPWYDRQASPILGLPLMRQTAPAYTLSVRHQHQ